jgi:hypothetical protein
MSHRTCSRSVSESAPTPDGFGTLFVSLELSQSTWLITSLAPGSATMSSILWPQAMAVNWLVG